MHRDPTMRFLDTAFHKCGLPQLPKGRERMEVFRYKRNICMAAAALHVVDGEKVIFYYSWEASTLINTTILPP